MHPLKIFWVHVPGAAPSSQSHLNDPPEIFDWGWLRACGFLDVVFNMIVGDNC